MRHSTAGAQPRSSGPRARALCAVLRLRARSTTLELLGAKSPDLRMRPGRSPTLLLCGEVAWAD